MTSGLVAQAAPERVSPLELPPTEFRQLGHELVDRIADFLSTLRDRPVTAGETPATIRALLGTGPLPRAGAAPAALLPDAAALLFDHSLFNGHGGKGANLAEMCRIGLPVPPGFTITTEVCTYYYANKRTYPSALQRADGSRRRRASSSRPARSSAT